MKDDFSGFLEFLNKVAFLALQNLIRQVDLQNEDRGQLFLLFTTLSRRFSEVHPEDLPEDLCACLNHVPINIPKGNDINISHT